MNTKPVSPVGLLIPFTAISRKLPLALSLAFFGITSMDCLDLLFCFSRQLEAIFTANYISSVTWNVHWLRVMTKSHWLHRFPEWLLLSTIVDIWLMIILTEWCHYLRSKSIETVTNIQGTVCLIWGNYIMWVLNDLPVLPVKFLRTTTDTGGRVGGGAFENPV